MKVFKRYLKRKIAPKAKRSVAFYLALIIFFECGFPSLSFALTSGPSQPEVQSFEPIGTSEMVDVFSGDFSYNLPLIDVDGYPINLSYHSGVTMDQEASWCGLGWNINPGVVNRNMRGIPDDFAGDVVKKEFKIKKNATVGVSTGFSGELFGLDFASFNARVGIKYNNYNGVGIEKSFNVSVSASNKYGGSGTASLGITSSSDDGMSLQPGISLSQNISAGERSQSVGVSITAAYNSRGGLSQLTIKPSVNLGLNFGKVGNYLNNVAKSAYRGAVYNFVGQTYTPSLDMPMENLSITGNFKIGGEIYGFDGSLSIGGYYSEQRLATNTILNPAYGYMNSQYGQHNSNAMMDFNREKDGSFNNSTYNLPVTNSTYDLYSVSGQGAGGSYRPMRSDVGHVFDAAGYSTSDGYEIGVEVGLGNLTHVGVNVTVNSANSNSGDWNTTASSRLSHINNAEYPDYEAYYFKEANEKTVDPDQDFYENFGGNLAARCDLDGSTKFNATTNGDLELQNSVTKPINSNHRNSRDGRSQTIAVLSNKEVAKGFGLNGIMNDFVGDNLNGLGHHIGQITSLGPDGKRYVYGLPAYNLTQEETSFATGVPEGGGTARYHSDQTGLVSYSKGVDNSTGNSMGLDNYFNNIVTPAYAHSYLLTGVISSDYVDVDAVKGPSDGDLGTYVKFKYNDITDANGATYPPINPSDKVYDKNSFNWRTPLGEGQAKHNDGLLSSDNDDKGSYVYGEKQVFFLNEIETKNYKAIFYTSDRNDALGVIDKNGKVATNGVKQKKLDKIELISKASGEVVKTVHFEYNYDLCKPSADLCNGSSTTLPNSSSGKLTLTRVYFTYQKSDKGAFNAYRFKYAGQAGVNGQPAEPGINPAYNLMKYDRWGNYKCSNPGGIPFDFFPYTNQYATKAENDAWSYAWHLTKIELPSGGEIKVNYESDDYAYVQNEKATQMYTIISGSNDFENSVLKVNVPVGTDINDLLPDDDMIFFKFLMDLNGGKKDYIPGYAQIDRGSCSVSGNVATIKLVEATLKDNGGTSVNPIVKAAIQFGRLNNSRLMFDQPNASDGISEQVLKALLNSGFFQNIQQTVQGPNQYIYDKGRGRTPDFGNCWIKLKNVTGAKFGGGSRVKSVILNDKFHDMLSSGNDVEDSEYGQLYDYTTKTNSGKVISSGVASYEPQIGGEENALKHPFFTETKHLLAPDDQHYAEAPFGESFYPAATIGYSKVKVKNYVPPISGTAQLKRHATGHIVHEFYTAKDFPTITDRTGLEAINHKNDPFSLASLFSIECKDYMTVSQGFYIELNDMHGKPKSQKVYSENDSDTPISSTEYRYKSTPYGNGSSRLENKCKVIYSDGSVKDENIGLFFDAVGDFRQQETESQSYGLNVNVDGFLVPVIPIFIPVPLPSYSSDKTKFQSTVLTKVVQRFGILDETTATQDGSIVTTKNVAYDAETGNVLLTQVNNNYDDAMYAFNYPAYWHYSNMGAAYKNINYTLQNVTFNGSGVANINPSNNKFIEGDELELKTGNDFYSLGWVTKVTPTSIEVQKMDGTPINGTYGFIKVIRSGNRNLLTTNMSNITTMVNPLNGIKTNLYDKVIQASAVEFGNRWRTNCACNTDANGNEIVRNPYANGVKGVWRPVKNYTYLTGRTQSDYNNNTNIRKDGVFTSYSPYYKMQPNGKWSTDQQNWTYATEITEFNPFGQEVENVDALGRASSALYGFNQTMATAVASNTQFKELGYDSFEDYGLSSCADKHFKFATNSSNTAHTGRRSIRVNGGSQTMEKQIAPACEKIKMCPGTITYNSATQSYVITNATAPLNISYQVVSGSGTVLPTATGNGFSVLNATGGFKAMVTITDEAGCTYTKLITQ